MRSPAPALHEAEAPSPSRIPLWLPWLVAPAFVLLPLVGCGAAASLRHADTAHATPPPLMPIPAVATIMPPRH